VAIATCATACRLARASSNDQLRFTKTPSHGRLSRVMTTEALGEYDSFLIGQDNSNGKTVYYIAFKLELDVSNWALQESSKDDKIHPAIKKAYFKIKRTLFENLLANPDSNFVFTGYGFGGALAMVIVYKLLADVPAISRIRCITFAAPPVFSEPLAKRIKAEYAGVFKNVICLQDMTPRMLHLVSLKSEDIYQTKTVV
jgi:hypothetical protein